MDNDYLKPGAAALVLQRCGCFRPNLSSEDKYKPGVVDTFCVQTNQATVGVGTEQKKNCAANVFHPVKARFFFFLSCYKWVKSVVFTQECFTPYQELHKVRDVWSHFRGEYSLCSMQWFTCCTALLFIISLLLLILQTNDVSWIVRVWWYENLPPSKSWTFTVLALNLQYILVLFQKKDRDKPERLLEPLVLASPWTGRPPPPPSPPP